MSIKDNAYKKYETMFIIVVKKNSTNKINLEEMRMTKIEF